MHIFSDRLSQSDRAGYRMNHSPFVCRHANRGRITYILRGSPTIPSMIPMVLSDDTPTGCMPHGQTALAGILPSGFTPTSRSDTVRSSGSRLPTPAVARTTSSPAKSLNESTQDDPNRWNLHSTPPGDTVIPGVRPEFPSDRSGADTTRAGHVRLPWPGRHLTSGGMCTPRDDRSNARSTHADSPILLRGHIQPSVSESWIEGIDSTKPSTKNINSIMTNSCQVYERPYSHTLRGTTPRRQTALTSKSVYQKTRRTRIELESTSTRARCLESTSNTISHQSHLESTSNGFGTRRPATRPEDGTWNPPVTPRKGWPRRRNVDVTSNQHPQVMKKSVRHRMHRFSRSR